MSNMERFTFKDFEAMFPDDAACLEWLRLYLYPDGIFCKTCNQIRTHHRVKSRPSYSCDYCGHRRSPDRRHHLSQVQHFDEDSGSTRST